MRRVRHVLLGGVGESFLEEVALKLRNEGWGEVKASIKASWPKKHHGGLAANRRD